MWSVRTLRQIELLAALVLILLLVFSCAAAPARSRATDQVVDDATITSHVKRVRANFLAADPAFDAIETVYGLGYRWNA